MYIFTQSKKASGKNEGTKSEQVLDETTAGDMYSHIRVYRLVLTRSSGVLPEKLTGSQHGTKFPKFYGTPKVHCRFHKCPPPVPILSLLDPVHTPKSTS